MTHEQIAIIALLIAQAATLYLLWGLHSERDKWRKAWLLDTKELIYWKRNAVQRDPKTGKYVKKVK